MGFTTYVLLNDFGVGGVAVDPVSPAFVDAGHYPCGHASSLTAADHGVMLPARIPSNPTPGVVTTNNRSRPYGGIWNRKFICAPI